MKNAVVNMMRGKRAWVTLPVLVGAAALTVALALVASRGGCEASTADMPYSGAVGCGTYQVREFGYTVVFRIPEGARISLADVDWGDCIPRSRFCGPVAVLRDADTGSELCLALETGEEVCRYIEKMPGAFSATSTNTLFDRIAGSAYGESPE